MGTRSRVAVMHGDVCKSVYCHYDGYLDYTGRILQEHYGSTQANALIARGDNSGVKPTLEEMNFYEDRVKASKTFRAPTGQEAAAFRDLANRLGALPADTTDGEVIQNEVYAVGKEHAFEPLRAWFSGLYEVLLGSSQGPRFGSFAAIYGLERTIALLESGANGDLAA